MTGKVFEDSADIYQDQAQVLFDYYRQAAEKIVREEQTIVGRAAQTEKQRQEALAAAEAAVKSLTGFLVGTGACAVLSIIGAATGVAFLVLVGVGGIIACAITAYNKYKEQNGHTEKAAQLAADLAKCHEDMAAVRRNYRVERVGVAYVPVARRVPVGERSLVVDYTGEQPDTQLSLTLINQPDELRDAVQSLHSHLSDIPIVESNDETEEVDTSDYSTSMQGITLHDYMGSIDRQVRTMGYLVGDSREVSVSVPAIAPTSERYRFLSEHATSDTSSYPVVPVFDATPVQRKIEQFGAMGSLNEQSTQDGSGDVDFFMDVMRELAQGVDVLSRARTASVSALTSYCSHIFGNVLKAAFDQYSPTLEAEEIERIRNATFNYADDSGSYQPFSLKESSRVHYDIFADAWIADNGSRTAVPFGMHQVDAEVLMPVIDNLMQENRMERLRIYSDIQNQKTDYLNQWHRETMDFFERSRSEAHTLFQQMNEAYASYVENYTNYQQQSATFQTMKKSGNLSDAEVAEADNQAQVVEGFQLQTCQAREKQEQLTSYMDRISADIDECAERFGHVEYYEASLRDTQARATAQAVVGMAELDERRKNLAAVSAYLAQNGVVPPEPTVSDQLNADFVIDLTSRVRSEIDSLAAHDAAQSSEHVTEGADE